MDPTVTKTDTGWIVKKIVGSKSAVVEFTDDNKDGKLDQTDGYKILSGSTSIFTQEEWDACFKSTAQQEGSEGTAEDLFKSSKTQRQVAQEGAFQRYQQQQMQQEQPKKGFWAKFGNAITIGVSGLMGALGGFFGFGLGANAWAFNSGSSNDNAIRGFGAFAGAMGGMSGAMLGMVGNGGYQAGGYSVGGAGGNDYGAMFQQIAEMQNQENAKRQEEQEKALEEQKAAQEKQQAEAEKKAVISYAKDIHDYSKEENATICDSNKAAINRIYDLNTEGYDEADTDAIKKMAKYAEIPYELIADSKDDKTKLQSGTAKKLHDALKCYSLAANDLKKEEIMSPEQYNRIQELFSKTELTEADVKELDGLAKEVKVPKK